MKRITIINGPNLNLLGEREPYIYGTQRFEDFFAVLQKRFADSVVLTYMQSNVEGELINYIQQARKNADALVINAGGYSHTSVAIHDALLSVELPVVEVHISNVAKREAFRHTDLIASACNGTISGLGLQGYELAIAYLLNVNETKK